MSHTNILGLLGTCVALLTLNGCYYERSGSTGWAYNFTDNGGFERPAYFEQETGPGLIFIEGGTYTMGQVDDDLNYAWDNIPRRVSVSSFYMDETEVTNQFCWNTSGGSNAFMAPRIQRLSSVPCPTLQNGETNWPTTNRW